MIGFDHWKQLLRIICHVEQPDESFLASMSSILYFQMKTIKQVVFEAQGTLDCFSAFVETVSQHSQPHCKNLQLLYFRFWNSVIVYKYNMVCGEIVTTNDPEVLDDWDYMYLPRRSTEGSSVCTIPPQFVLLILLFIS